MSSQALLKGIPTIVKAAAKRTCYSSSRRFFATSNASATGTTVKAAAATTTKKQATPSKQGNNSNRNGGKKDKKQNRTNQQAKVDTNRNFTAAAIAATENDAVIDVTSQNNKNDTKMDKVITRLADNHPITMDDRDPRYYMEHLTKDQLEEPYPLFPEDRDEFPEQYETTHKSSSIDANGNKVTAITHNISEEEMKLAESGVFFPKEHMFGYNSSTPLSVNSMDELVNLEDDEEEEKKSASTENSLEFDKTVPTDEKELDDDNEEAVNDLFTMAQDGDILGSSPFIRGSDVQTDIEVTRAMNERYGRRLRQEHRRMALGYDHRQFNNTEPWVDTHRIEGIDARLHELHLQRANGSLNYPIEKDAAKEGERIRKEEEKAIMQIRKAIGLKKGESLENVKVRGHKVQPFTLKGKSLLSLHQHSSHQMDQYKEDNTLDNMPIADIPIEKLYQARRQELERLRHTHYEDYDLNWLLMESNKDMNNMKGGQSLYELSHGETSEKRRRRRDEEENPMIGARYLTKQLSDDERMYLKQELALFEKYGELNEEEIMGLYGTSIQIITPEMKIAMQDMNMDEEEKGSKQTDDLSLNTDLFENKDKIANAILQTNTTSKKTMNSASVHNDDTVDTFMNQVKNDKSKPLQDTEVGVIADGSLVVARRKHRGSLPNYAQDKEEFMQGVQAAFNRDISEEDKKNLNKMVVTDDDIEKQRQAIGLPRDLSKKEYYNKYLKEWKEHKDDGDMVSELMTGYSVSKPDAILHTLGLDSEEGIENYLMDSFNDHIANEEDLLPGDEVKRRKLLDKANAAIQEAKKKLAELKKANGGEAEAAEGKKEGEAVEEKKEGEAEAAPAEEAKEAKEGEAAPAEEAKEAKEAETETPAPAEEAKEGETETPKEGEETTTPTSHSPIEAYNQKPEDIINAAMDRMNQEQQEAEELSPFYEEYNDAYEGSHIVDALEYNNDVYVHESDRQMIYKLYKQGIHPHDISQSFGYHESRVYAILRLMQRREEKKKQGMYSDKQVDQLEKNESVFDYEYRDFPPAEFKTQERRKVVKSVPSSIPRFVFLNENDDETEVMKNIDKLVSHKKRTTEIKIDRHGLPVGKVCKAKDIPNHTYKMAIMDLSVGAKNKVVLSDQDGMLRELNEEEDIHRTWNRCNLKKKERLLKLGL